MDEHEPRPPSPSARCAIHRLFNIVTSADSSIPSREEQFGSLFDVDPETLAGSADDQCEYAGACDVCPVSFRVMAYGAIIRSMTTEKMDTCELYPEGQQRPII